MGMPGRKGERDQYVFFSPLLLAGEREGWWWNLLQTQRRITIARSCDMSAPLLKVILSSSPSCKCAWWIPVWSQSQTWHVHYRSLCVHNLDKPILRRTRPSQAAPRVFFLFFFCFTLTQFYLIWLMLETHWRRTDIKNSTASERSRVRVKPVNVGKDINSIVHFCSVSVI